MKSLTIGVLTIAVAVVLTASASAAIFEDNFDSYTDGNPLEGQVNASTGTTWKAFDLWNGSFGSMQSTSNNSQSGLAAGGGAGGGGENSVAIDLAERVTSGRLVVDYDMHVGSNRQSGPQWWLRDAANGANVSLALDWIDNANGGIDPQSGIHNNDPNDPNGTMNPPNLMWNEDITEATQSIHGHYEIDIDNKTIQYTLTSIEEPGKSADSGLLDYSKTFEPDSIYLYLSAISSSNERTYDNFSIVVPEPTTLALTSIAAGVCCLSMFRRRRRR